VTILDPKTNIPRPARGKHDTEAEPPRAATRTSTEKRLKKSTYLGILFTLQYEGQLTDEQGRYLLKLQSTVKFEELQSAYELMESYRRSPRSRARASEDFEHVLRTCPRLPAKSIIPEGRRIGVGYRDKGSLRPSHKPRAEQPRMWWSEDLAPALLNPPEEPCWISSEELFGPKRYSEIQMLAFDQYFIQNSNGLNPLDYIDSNPFEAD